LQRRPHNTDLSTVGQCEPGGKAPRLWGRLHKLKSDTPIMDGRGEGP